MRERVWSKISNALKRLSFRSRNFLAQLLSEVKPREHVQCGSTIKFREALECFGRGCLPMSPEQSIKNSCCEMNIWRRRTGSCEVRSRVGYCFRKEKRRHWLRLVTGWVEWCWTTWRQRPSPKRFWVGIGSSSRTNLTGRNPVEG